MTDLIVCLYREHPDGYLVHEERKPFQELCDELKTQILKDLEADLLEAITKRREDDRSS